MWTLCKQHWILYHSTSKHMGLTALYNQNLEISSAKIDIKKQNNIPYLQLHIFKHMATVRYKHCGRLACPKCFWRIGFGNYKIDTLLKIRWTTTLQVLMTRYQKWDLAAPVVFRGAVSCSTRKCKIGISLNLRKSCKHRRHVSSSIIMM